MENNKTTQIQIRVSVQEKSEIKAKAKSLNLNVSEYILSQHHNKDLPPPPSEIERQQLTEIAKVGNMINELLSIVRSGTIPDSFEIQLVIEAISCFIKYHEQKK
ncbi:MULTISPECIES: plasmid mobilization protein [unclassified Endozoicomonas]|uniref:plasmid mobilization protein n=1 Tax=unclassified Endozoicomonas TaxID=2644528 RepID=UPI003BB72B49